MYKRMHKALAFVLIFVLMSSSLGSLSAYADTNPGSDWQIKRDESSQTLYHTLNASSAITGTGTSAKSQTPGGKVEIFKEIGSTEHENIFKIDLTVKTKQQIKETHISPDAAVVLVLDVSQSMQGSRITEAKKAAKDFLVQYVANSNGAARYVSIVAFNTSAWYVVNNWTNATALNWSSGSNSTNTLTTAINGLSASNYTNIHHGLMLAKTKVDSLPTGVARANSFVVLLTDGAPNRYIDSSGNVQNNNGGRTGHYINPPLVAAQITSAGTKLYSISYGAWNDNISNSGSTKVGPWLQSFSTMVFASTDASGLTTSFQSITNEINLVTKAWTVTDPMGPFMVIDQADNSHITFNAPSSPNLVKYSDTTRILDWNLNGYPHTTTGSGTDTIHTYTLSYFVRLNTAAPGFAEDTYYLTNGYTKLEYAFYDGNGKLMDESGKFIYNSDGTINNSSDKVTTLRTLDFKVPAVKGTIPTVTYTIEYYKQDRNNLSNYTLAETSAPISAKLWTSAGLPSGYAGKFANYAYDHSNPSAPMVISANNMVLKLYYKLIPTNAIVNHYFRTDGYDVNGVFSRGSYGTPTVDTTSTGLYQGDRFPSSGDVTLRDTGGYTLVTADDSPHPVSDPLFIGALGATGTNIINLYYVKTQDARKDASVEVYKIFKNYEWQLNSGTGVYEKILVSTTGDDVTPVITSGNIKIPANYTQGLTESGYDLTALTLNGSPATAPGGTITFALVEGINKLVAKYEKTTDNRVQSSVTVNHIYTRHYTVVSGGVATSYTDPNGVTGFTDNIPKYVGETYTFDESTDFKLVYNSITYPAPTSGPAPITVSAVPSENVINIYYLIADSAPKTSATVNHFFRTWTSSVDPDNGDILWTLSSTDATDVMTYSNLFVGTLFNAPLNPNNRTGYTQDLMSAQSSNVSVSSGILGAESNVFNIYYDRMDGDPPEAGSATVIHEYYEDVLTVSGGSIITERRLVGSTTDTVWGPTGSSHTFAPVPSYASHTFTRFDTSNLTVPFNGTSITLKYVRDGQSELVPTDLSVTHNYFSRTMVVTGGVAGYADEAPDGFTSTYIVKDSDGNILGPDDLYIGLQVTVEEAPLYNSNAYAPKGTNPSRTFILGEEGTNILSLAYTRDIPLDRANIIVNHTYEETVYTYPGGIETINVVTTYGATNGSVAATKYVGESYTAATAPGGFALTDATHNGSTITPDGTNYTITVAPGTNTVDFLYKKTSGKLDPAHVTVNHFYTDVDFDGSKTGYEADPASYTPDTVGVSSFAGMPFTATPIYREDGDGLNGYDLAGKDASPDFDEGLTITLVAGEDNVINLYYTRKIDTRMETSATVYHHYSVYDIYTGTTTDEGTETESFSSFEDGIWVGNTFTATSAPNHNDREYVLDAEGSDPLTITLLAIGEDGENIIHLYYQRTVDSTPPYIPPVQLDRYTITVNYKDLATGDDLAPPNVSTLTEFSTYDVTAATNLTITGYVLDSITGDPVSGTLRNNVTITVYYTAETVEIDEPDIPLTEPDDTDTDITTIDIEDTSAPLGDAPPTGDSSSLVAWIAAALASTFGMAWLTVSDIKRRKKSIS